MGIGTATGSVKESRDAPVRLALLRAEMNLKLPDCCVLLAAQHAAGASVLTFDDRLEAHAVRLGLTGR